MLKRDAYEGFRTRDYPMAKLWRSLRWGTHLYGVNKCLNNWDSADWIAKIVLRDVHPNIIPRKIIKIINNKYQIKVNYKRAWRERKKARESIFGNVNKS